MYTFLYVYDINVYKYNVHRIFLFGTKSCSMVFLPKTVPIDPGLYGPHYASENKKICINEIPAK